MGSNVSRSTSTTDSTTAPTGFTSSSSPSNNVVDLYGGTKELKDDISTLIVRLRGVSDEKDRAIPTRNGGDHRTVREEVHSTANARVGHIERGGTHLCLQHIPQQATWDCGIACLQMILTHVAASAPFSSLSIPPSRDALLARVGTRSIWTIDLLYLLKPYLTGSQRAVFLVTASPGVCVRHATLSYYTKAGQFGVDRKRVLRLFRAALGNGLRVYEGRLSWEDLRDLVCTGRVLLVLLVNQRLLPSSSSLPSAPSSLPSSPPPGATSVTPKPLTTEASSSSSIPIFSSDERQSQHEQGPHSETGASSSSMDSPSCNALNADPPSSFLPSLPPALPPPSSSSAAYCGHYILITGYRPASPPPCLPSSPPSSPSTTSGAGFFLYKDPAKAPLSPGEQEGKRGGTEQECRDHLIEVSALEKARRAEGTDEDILVVEV